MNGITWPISVGVGKIESAGKSAAQNPVTKLPSQQEGHALQLLKISRSAMEQKETGFFPSAPMEIRPGSSGSEIIAPISHSIPKAWMRKMSSVCLIGISGMANTSSVSLMTCSRETIPGGSQLLFFTVYLPKTLALFVQVSSGWISPIARSTPTPTPT